MPAFFFNDSAPTEIYPLPLHDALPIPGEGFPVRAAADRATLARFGGVWPAAAGRSAHPTISLPEKNCAISFSAVSGASEPCTEFSPIDRKSTRLNSRHPHISYARFFF